VVAKAGCSCGCLKESRDTNRAAGCGQQQQQPPLTDWLCRRRRDEIIVGLVIRKRLVELQCCWHRRRPRRRDDGPRRQSGRSRPASPPSRPPARRYFSTAALQRPRYVTATFQIQRQQADEVMPDQALNPELTVPALTCIYCSYSYRYEVHHHCPYMKLINLHHKCDSVTYRSYACWVNSIKPVLLSVNY